VEDGMNQEEQQFQKRIADIAQRAYMENRYYNTRFLNEAEQELVLQMRNQLPVDIVLDGGFSLAERKLCLFGSEEMYGYAMELPIALLHITPVSRKFGEELGHRDVLGAVMNLGIERELIGDILIKDKEAYLFCMESMADYIMNSLGKIRHTIVTLTKVALSEVETLSLVSGKTVGVLVPSLRLDAVVASVYHLSRQQAQLLIRERKVMVAGRVNENNSGSLKDGVMVSVRGKGRFFYEGVQYQTKKGKYQIQVEVY
jgi:RNA-binding protein YlmH